MRKAYNLTPDELKKIIIEYFDVVKKEPISGVYFKLAKGKDPWGAWGEGSPYIEEVTVYLKEKE